MKVVRTDQLALLLGVALAITGCKSTMVVYSQPDGAYITEVSSGTSFGMAPATVVYKSKTLKQNVDENGCYLVRGVQATWVSGVSATMNPIRLCGRSNGTYNITISRDPSLPGLDKDLQFALQIQSARAQDQQQLIQLFQQQQLISQPQVQRLQQPLLIPQPQQPPQPTRTICTMVGNIMQCNTQ